MGFLGILGMMFGLGSIIAEDTRNSARNAESIKRAKERGEDMASTNKGYVWVKTGEPCEFDYDYRTKRNYVRSKKTGVILKDETAERIRHSWDNSLKYDINKEMVKIYIEGEDNNYGTPHTYYLDTFTMEVYRFSEGLTATITKCLFPENPQRDRFGHGYEVCEEIQVSRLDDRCKPFRSCYAIIDAHFPRDKDERRKFFRNLCFDNLSYADQQRIINKATGYK